VVPQVKASAHGTFGHCALHCNVTVLFLPLLLLPPPPSAVLPVVVPVLGDILVAIKPIVSVMGLAQMQPQNKDSLLWLPNVLLDKCLGLW
jgi:hypothetical protein